MTVGGFAGARPSACSPGRRHAFSTLGRVPDRSDDSCPVATEYVGIEPDPISFGVAKTRIGDRGRLLNCRFEDLPPAQEFDLVCAFEVLEHIEDDAAALGEWIQHLRPRGWLLLSVPKDRRRYGPVNARVGDLRRYDLVDLERLLANAGLRRIVMVRYGSTAVLEPRNRDRCRRARPARVRSLNRREPTRVCRVRASPTDGTC